jgi:hypothetical protein
MSGIRDPDEEAQMEQRRDPESADALAMHGPLRPPEVLDPTPPDDHEGFLEVRELGLRAMQQHLARRRKVS